MTKVIILTGLMLGSTPSAFAQSDFAKNILLGPDILKLTLGDNLDEARQSIKVLCQKLTEVNKAYFWNASSYGCNSNVSWKARFKSPLGHPLIWTEFGTGPNTTLILGGVHPDEITPVPIAFRFANHLANNPALLNKDSRVVVAPLVNPDGFFRKTPARTNQHGVDLNRNFLTEDWYKDARKWWAEKRQNNPRHFPGYMPNSEIETLFQIWLIDTFKPDKIISIHAPLGFYDYDGPGKRKTSSLTQSEEKAKELIQTMSDRSRNYKIVDYSFYPGSLGNYAGNERQIPTVTLELETTNPKLVDAYWAQFSPGLEHAIVHPFEKDVSAVKRFFEGQFLGLYQNAQTIK